MRVRDLIEALQKLDPLTLVVLSSDAEGNSYRTLFGLWEGAFDREEQEAGLRELDAELRDAGYEEEDVVDGEPCVVLW